MPAVLIAILLLFGVAAPAPGPNFSGTWQLDRDLTTADLRWDKTDTLIVRQSDDQVTFQYFDRQGHLFGTDTFITDWVERPRYKTRIERAYSRARWQTGQLFIFTRAYLDWQGYQWYSGSEGWQLSPDGKILVDETSDGKVLVFQKKSSAAAVVPP